VTQRATDTLTCWRCGLPIHGDIFDTATGSPAHWECLTEEEREDDA